MYNWKCSTTYGLIPFHILEVLGVHSGSYHTRAAVDGKDGNIVQSASVASYRRLILSFGAELSNKHDSPATRVAPTSKEAKPRAFNALRTIQCPE